MTSDHQSKADRSSRQAKIDAAGPKPSKARPVLIVTVVLVTLLALGAAVFFGSRSSAPDASPAPSGSADYPPSATGAEGGISVNADKVQQNTPRLDIYEDFQCPACQQIERALGPTIKQMADAGEVQVVYHIKTFLDANLRNDASMRASIGAACADDAGHFQAYHDQVYGNPPAQEGQGWTDEQLQQFAGSAGLSGQALTTWQQCTAQKKYEAYFQRVEEATARDGITSTPSFRVNGKDFKLDEQQVSSAEDFRTKVLAAAK